MIFNNLLKNRPFAFQRVGEIVTARIANPIQNPKTQSKARPAILLRRDGAFWLVMGLTTLSTFANGTPRLPVPHPDRYGLDGRGSFFWGATTRICSLDVGDHVGFADAELMGVVATMH
jgi:hypothetical protein